MPLIQWLSRLLNRLRPAMPVARVPRARTRRRSQLHRLKALPWVVATSLCFSPVIHGASAEALPSQGTGKGTIVAAGFGHQIGDLSVITVKVYDAGTGDVLSDDTFDLHVKEDQEQKAGLRKSVFLPAGSGSAPLTSRTLFFASTMPRPANFNGKANSI